MSSQSIGGTHSFTHSPHIITFLVVVVQLLSRVQLFATPWTAARQAPLSSTVYLSLLKFMLIELVMLSNHTTAFLHTRNIIDPKTKKWISYNLSSRCLLRHQFNQKKKKKKGHQDKECTWEPNPNFCKTVGLGRIAWQREGKNMHPYNHSY